MGWKVVYSKRSQRDLERIVTRIAKDDPIAAERFGFQLIAKSESLATSPEMGTPMTERPGTRFLPRGTYLIIYRPNSKMRLVHILRFWHSARGFRPRR